MVWGWQSSATKNALALGLVEGVGHVHGLGRGGGLVEERCVGQGQGGEVGHHGLEVQEGLEAALGDLGLVGRVLRVPAGVLEDVALDDRRGDAVVIPHAQERPEHLVAVGQRAQTPERLALAPGRGQVEGRLQADPLGQGLVDEGVERRQPEDAAASRPPRPSRGPR